MKNVCVIGGANIDITATPHLPLIIKDSNPAVTTTTLGGVGRNIAENLARMGIEVEFITVLGHDHYADLITRNCEELNIGISNCRKSLRETSTYLCINDHLGDLYLGASDMGILESLDKNFLQTKIDVINKAAAVVIDTNLTSATLNYLLNYVTSPIFVETVSANKVAKLNALKGAFCVKPNAIEAEMLTGIKILDEQSLRQASLILRQKGYNWVIITLGADGAYYDDGTRCGFAPTQADKIVNSTGAGDSFLAAVITAYVNGQDIARATAFGNFVAAMTLSTVKAVSEQLSPTVLTDYLAKK